MMPAAGSWFLLTGCVQLEKLQRNETHMSGTVKKAGSLKDLRL